MATIIVDVLDDITDAGDGETTLREAVAAANSGDIIKFSAGLAGGTLVLTQGQISLTDVLTIDGDVNSDNKADIIISGGGTTRLFAMSGATVDVDLLSLTLTNGFNNFSSGGAIFINSGATLDIVDSSILNSYTTNAGGGIDIADADVSLTNVLIAGNSSGVSSGGLFVKGTSNVTLTNTTVYGNSSNGNAGGIGVSQTATLTLYNSTVIGNHADIDGTNIYNGGGIGQFVSPTIIIHNSVIARNTSGSAYAFRDVFATIATASNSFFGVAAGVTITNDIGDNSILGGGDPLLGALLYNGAASTVLTNSPVDGSQLIGAGLNASLPSDLQDLDEDFNVAEDLPLDGRRGLRIEGGTVDIGAVEQVVDEIISGNDDANIIVGGLGNDTLNGGAGDDTLDGGVGTNSLDGGDDTDTASYASAAGPVTVDLSIAGAQATGNGTDTLTNIENLTGSDQDDSLKGNAGANNLQGGSGKDTLEGGAGADVLDGGDGSDTASYANAGAGIFINLATPLGNSGDGAGDTYTSIENLTGTAFADGLTGDANDNILKGGGGNDTLHGGGGNDAASFVDASGDMTIDLRTGTVTGPGIGTDTLISIENAEGSNFNDTIFGNDFSNVLNGNDGADTIFAFGADDTVNGGDGNDTLNGNDDGDIVNGDGGDDLVLGAGGNDTLNGGADNDTVSGGSGDDTVSGGSGADLVFGGGNNDTLFGNDGNDTLSGGSGADITSGGNNDDLVLGAAGNDTVLGGAGADTVSGGSGLDEVGGGAGNDEVFGAGGNDTISGGSGDDTVSGGTEDDDISGNSGADSLIGAGGIDRLDGGTGDDILTGGSGADTLVFALGYEFDTVQGFEDDIDTLELDQTLWGGGLTAAQVVTTFATQLSPGIVEFDFGGGDILRVVQGAGITTTALVDDIAIV